jgi:hypothetical protein
MIVVRDRPYHGIIGPGTVTSLNAEMDFLDTVMAAATELHRPAAVLINRRLARIPDCYSEFYGVRACSHFWD